MRQFQYRYYRQRDLGVAGLRTNRLQYLVRGLALALRRDDHRRIEDQSHDGGSNGSRWLSMPHFFQHGVQIACQFGLRHVKLRHTFDHTSEERAPWR